MCNSFPLILEYFFAIKSLDKFIILSTSKKCSTISITFRTKSHKFFISLDWSGIHQFNFSKIARTSHLNLSSEQNVFFFLSIR